MSVWMSVDVVDNQLIAQKRMSLEVASQLIVFNAKICMKINKVRCINKMA